MKPSQPSTDEKRSLVTSRLWMLVTLCVVVVLAVLLFRTRLRPSKPETRLLQDAKGRVVEIPKQVNRIACPGALNQVVLMLGGADKIAATATVVQQNKWFVRVYPAIKDRPAPYGIASPVANLETLLAAQPDVVFGAVDQHRNLVIPVVEVSLEDAEGIKRTVKVVGEVLGGDAVRRAEEFVSFYDEAFRRAKEVSSRIPPERRVRVYTASGRGYLQTDGSRSIATAWIEAGGGNNVAASAVTAPSSPVTLEDVLRWDPEVIFTILPADRDGLLAEPRWAGVSAVKNRRVYASPRGVYPWAVRSGEGALQVLWAAKKMHPEEYEHVALEEETRSFYRKFYQLELSNEDLKSILEPSE